MVGVRAAPLGAKAVEADGVRRHELHVARAALGRIEDADAAEAGVGAGLRLENACSCISVVCSGSQGAGSDRPKLPVEVTEQNPWVDRLLSLREASRSFFYRATDARTR